MNGYGHGFHASHSPEQIKIPGPNSANGRGVGLLTTSTYTYEALKESADYVLSRTSIKPKIGIICGSGMNNLAEKLTKKTYFPYEDIPNFPVSTVEGHIGRLVFGYLDNVPLVCMQGRFHYYEGYPLWKCCMPVRVMKLIGVTHLIATNAAGGVRSNYKVGDIMLINDHINLMGFAGNNPLQGPNDDRFGDRFPPMNQAYDKELLAVAKSIVKELNIENTVHEGVYTCLGGPNFETVAEVKMLKLCGIDAVGMSTVHEVITARHCNMTVFALSLITNICVSDANSTSEAAHDEVLTVGKLKEEDLINLATKMVQYIQNKIEKNGH